MAFVYASFIDLVSSRVVGTTAAGITIGAIVTRSTTGVTATAARAAAPTVGATTTAKSTYHIIMKGKASDSSIDKSKTSVATWATVLTISKDTTAATAGITIDTASTITSGATCTCLSAAGPAIRTS